MKKIGIWGLIIVLMLSFSTLVYADSQSGYQRPEFKNGTWNYDVGGYEYGYGYYFWESEPSYMDAPANVLFKFSYETGERTKLADGVTDFISNGKMIYFVRNQNSIWKMDCDGNGLELVYNSNEKINLISDFKDNRYIIYETDARTDNIVDTYKSGVTVTFNGENIEFDQPPVILNGRTLVPIRAVIEKMGGVVEWNGDLQKVTLKLGGDTIILTINSSVAILNGEVHSLDVPPQVINNRTLLPIRFIAEGFKFNVEWLGETQTVKITTFKPEIEEIRTLVVRTSAELKPFEYYENGEIVGFDIDLIKRLAKDIGFNVVIKDIDFRNLVSSTVDGDSDIVIATLTGTDERKTKCDFTIPYLEFDCNSPDGITHNIFQIGVRKGDKIINDLNKYIEKYKNDGTIKELYEKWNVDSFRWDE